MKSIITAFLLALTVASATGQPKDRVASTPALGHDWRAGFINITELNTGLGLSQTGYDYASQYFGITTVNGYQFSRNIKAGVGFGVQVHNGGTLFPLYIDARYSFTAQEFVPFFAAAGGMALSFEDLTNESRIFINPSFGLKWVAATKLGVSLSTGIMVMSGGTYRTSFVNFKLGIEFKGRE